MKRAGKKSEATRARILDRALALFRKRGFADTTMRDVAEAAGVALGAAYYYFPSKEALLLAWYARNQLEATVELAGSLREKLGQLMHGKLDAVRRERKLLGAILPRLADPGDPISAFAKETREVREQSMALFARALDGEPLSDEVRRVLVPALWLLHMGFILYFIHDSSPRQARTHQLVEDTLDLVVPLVQLAESPETVALVARLGETLARARLV